MERGLVERARNGDEQAFIALIERIGDGLHSVSRRILRDGMLAEDATQQALLEIWRHLPQLRDPDRFEAWAHRLLIRACYAEVRRERRHHGQVRPLSRDELQLPDASSDLATHQLLDDAFRELSVEHRTVVVLIHYLGLSPAEAAERMGTPAGTARSRLHHAHRLLRSAIQAEERRAGMERRAMTGGVA
jgi:RNA polymerase sigma-70 factor (ECF subfamily)